MQAYFDLDAHQRERAELPILSALIERYRDEQPFDGLEVATSHVLVRNSLVTLETLYAGGAKLVLADAFPSPAAEPVKADLQAAAVPICSIPEAVGMADIYLDVNAVLGRQQAPRAVAEVTRTGIYHYQEIDTVVISADDCRSKRIEGFFGTGESLLRAWAQFKPDKPLAGKRAVQFGFGKIGRGVAFQLRGASVELLLVEVGTEALERAEADGFATLDANDRAGLERALKEAEVVVSVTGIPGIISQQYPKAWMTANQPVLISLGAEDEFGSDYSEDEILGGQQVPLNFHLAQPTLNRYVDAPLAAHVLALEAWVKDPEAYPPGIHPLPEAMDNWILNTWRGQWPDEDLTGIGDELGLR